MQRYKDLFPMFLDKCTSDKRKEVFDTFDYFLTRSKELIKLVYNFKKMTNYNKSTN